MKTVMRSQPDIFYEAFLARDARFDGKFFVGVKTTGIYCRPICPARPRPEHVEFFPDALAAEQAGYRPCLRCRPESAPFSPAWTGRSATVQRALRLIAEPLPDGFCEDAFASRLGVSPRHLRRLFSEELGRTPKQIRDSLRLNFARKLVVETPLPITQIALTSGFASIRRFNEAFKARYDVPPSRLRRTNRSPSADAAPVLKLPYRPPLDWEALVGFFRSHQIRGVEWVEGDRYRRVFRMDGATGSLCVAPDPRQPVLRLEVVTPQTRSLYRIVQNVRRMFDLDSDPLGIARAFATSEPMAKLTRKHPGLRLPQGWDPYETAICTILGQLVSTEQAGRLLGQLVESYGEPFPDPPSDRTTTLFPRPEVLATESLSGVGTTQARKETIREFSRRLLAGQIHLDPAQDPAAFRRSLMAIRGIGPWSAEYICLRALGDTDAFPAGDLVLRRALGQNPGLQPETLKPWRGYVAQYLWREYALLGGNRKGRTDEILL